MEILNQRLTDTLRAVSYEARVADTSVTTRDVLARWM